MGKNISEFQKPFQENNSLALGKYTISPKKILVLKSDELVIIFGEASSKFSKNSSVEPISVSVDIGHFC